MLFTMKRNRRGKVRGFVTIGMRLKRLFDVKAATVIKTTR